MRGVNQLIGDLKVSRLALTSHNIKSESRIGSLKRIDWVEEFGVCQNNSRHSALNVRMSFVLQSGFSQTHKTGNVGINTNFEFPYIQYLHLYHMLFVNIKLDVSRYESIIFEGCRLHWSSSFLNGTAKRKLAILAFLNRYIK